MIDSKNVLIAKVVNTMQVVVKIHDPPSPLLLYLEEKKLMKIFNDSLYIIYISVGLYSIEDFLS